MDIATKSKDGFNPYTLNGGTVLGIAGNDFAILAGDTRQVEGYLINSRCNTRIFDVGDNILMTANGFSADEFELIDRFKNLADWYKFNNSNKKLSIKSAARFTHHLLYRNRFFPLYVSTILAGLDEEGKGAIYSYDFVGSYEREQCRASGSLANLIMPFLDNQVNFKNQFDPTSKSIKKKPFKYLTQEEVTNLVKDAFNAAAERHIHVGDFLEVFVVSKYGIKKEVYPLRKD